MKLNRRPAMALICIVGVLLPGFGCIGKSEPARFYTLSSVQIQEPAMPAEASDNELAIGLGPIEFPEYLNRPQIVTRSQPNELQFSEFRRWAEPLSENFARTLSENLGRALDTYNVFVYPSPPQIRVTWQVILDISRFEGKLGDKVSLIARWVLVDGKDERVRAIRESRITEPVEGGDEKRFAKLVAAESRAVAALAEEIANEIRTLQSKR